MKILTPFVWVFEFPPILACWLKLIRFNLLEQIFQPLLAVSHKVHSAGVLCIQRTLSTKNLSIYDRAPQFTDNILQCSVFDIHAIIKNRCC